MKKTVSPALIGTFVMSGIVLAVIAVLLFGSGRAFEQRETYVSFFPGSVNGLSVGSNVAFRGVPIGSVTDVRLAMDFDAQDMGVDMLIPVVYEINLTTLANRGVTSGLSDAERMSILLDRGLSARLDTESLLTGRLYVSLDFRPDAERFTQGEDELLEIPSVRSPMGEVTTQLNALADKFVEMDVDEIVTSLRATLDGMNALLTNEGLQRLPESVDIVVDDLELTLRSVRDLAQTIESSVGPLESQVTEATERAEQSMTEVDETLSSLQEVMDPNAPLVTGLVSTLGELEEAARALRRVSEMIERDPSVLVRGRANGSGR
ncbi:MAG: MlaD family protein [Gemmatimonadota bacterium]